MVCGSQDKPAESRVVRGFSGRTSTGKSGLGVLSHILSLAFEFDDLIQFQPVLSQKFRLIRTNFLEKSFLQI